MPINVLTTDDSTIPGEYSWSKTISFSGIGADPARIGATQAIQTTEGEGGDEL